jgi:hypothetical protein
MSDDDIIFGDEDPEDRWSEDDEPEEKIEVLELTVVSISIELHDGDRRRALRRRDGALEALNRMQRVRGMLNDRHGDRLAELSEMLEDMD